MTGFYNLSIHLFCDSRGIQTHNLLIRSQMLYSVELGSLRSLFAGAKVHTFFGTTKLFRQFFQKIMIIPSFCLLSAQKTMLN